MSLIVIQKLTIPLLFIINTKEKYLFNFSTFNAFVTVLITVNGTSLSVKYQKYIDMSLSKSEKQSIVNNIKNSKTFSKTSTSRALLQYLFEATQNGTNLKEGVIEIEFFRETEITDKNNARVRVNIYNLRKKLSKYYEEEGKEDAYHLVIDKGQYEVRFQKKTSVKKILDKKSIFRLIPYLIMVLVIIVSLLLLLPPAKPKFWRTFLKEDVPTTLYVGDLFGIYAKTITGKYGWIRDFSINSLQELYQFSDSHPELRDDMRPAAYTYTTSMAVYSTQNLQTLFQKYDKRFSVRFTTRASISEIKEGNAIYVGSIKNNNPFIHFFNKENPYFMLKGEVLSFSNHTSLSDTIFNLAYGGEGTEYAIVSKLPGLNDTEQLIFFSDHDIGVTSTVEYFTTPDSVSNFQDKYLNDSKYFTAIFKADGQDRTNTDLELVMVVGH